MRSSASSTVEVVHVRLCCEQLANLALLAVPRGLEQLGACTGSEVECPPRPPSEPGSGTRSLSLCTELRRRHLRKRCEPRRVLRLVVRRSALLLGDQFSLQQSRLPLHRRQRVGVALPQLGQLATQPRQRRLRVAHVGLVDRLRTRTRGRDWRPGSWHTLRWARAPTWNSVSRSINCTLTSLSASSSARQAEASSSSRWMRSQSAST